MLKRETRYIVAVERSGSREHFVVFQEHHITIRPPAFLDYIVCCAGRILSAVLLTKAMDGTDIKKIREGRD